MRQNSGMIPFNNPGRFNANQNSKNLNIGSFNQNFNQRGNYGNFTMREKNNRQTEGNLFMNNNLMNNNIMMRGMFDKHQKSPRRNTISPPIHKKIDFDDFERNLLSNRRYKMEAPNRYLFDQHSAQSLMSHDYSEDDYTLEEEDDYTDDSSFVTDESEEEHDNLSVFSRRGNGVMNPGRYSPMRAERKNYGNQVLSPLNYNENWNKYSKMGYNQVERMSPKRKRKGNMSPKRMVDVNDYVKNSHYVSQGYNMNHVDGNSYRPAYNVISHDDEDNNLNYNNNYGSKALNYRPTPDKSKKKRSPNRRKFRKKKSSKGLKRAGNGQRSFNNVQRALPSPQRQQYQREQQQPQGGYIGYQTNHQTANTEKDNYNNYQTMNHNNTNLNYGYPARLNDNSHIYKGKTFYEKIFSKSFDDAMRSHAWVDYIRNSKEELNTVKNVQKIIKGQRFTGEKVYLPGSYKGITILLDLDETLIHSEERKPGVEYDMNLELKNPDGRVEHIGVMIRPYCYEFLERMSQKFELVVFTAAKQEYAEKVVKNLDPHNKMISGSLFRQNCSKAHQFHIKDFRVIGNRKPQNMILVDNLLYSFAANFENGIPIKPYTNGKDDWELMYLADTLSKLNNGDDVASFLIESMKLYHFYELLAEN